MAWDAQNYYQNQFDSNWQGQQEYYDPYQQGWGQNYDPNQAWGQEYDPNQAWGQEYYPELPQQPQTEEERQREEQEQLERLEQNRLYLRRARRRCVKEDWAALERPQQFLVEVLLEELQLWHLAEVTVKLQFLDHAPLQVSLGDKDVEGGPWRSGESDHFLQTVGEAGLSALDSKDKDGGTHPLEEAAEEEEKEHYVAKWSTPTGHSCLFSSSSLQLVEALERWPVSVEVECEDKAYGHLRLPELFSLTVAQSCQPEVLLPVSCEHRGVCELRDVLDVRRGRALLSVRLTAFGPAIVTSVALDEGGHRRYTLDPGPASAYLKQEKETEQADQEVLQPVIAEEDKACGITEPRTQDPFQQTVLWGNARLPCGCRNEGDCVFREPSQQRPTEKRLPTSSEVNLCRDVMPPTDPRGLRRFGKPLCDWHNLVGLEVKNSPGRDCPCAGPRDTTSQLGLDSVCPLCETSSRAMKMMPHPKAQSTPNPGPGHGLDDTHCGCDCYEMKQALNLK